MAHSKEIFTPFYKFDDCRPDKHTVRIKLTVEELKTKKPFGSAREAVNANITCDFTDRTLELSASIVGKDHSTEEKKYKFILRKLPKEIDPAKSRYDVKDGKVTIHLRKVKEESWKEYFAEMAPSSS